ncbi:penicillinase repressor BlaI [Alkalicoccobacillus porphyridii]|uniref:Penicillinase repressor BlaI n=1 Tax=Alkalicoccobacillus porphyridii TaxID=2597270 RepID=A0A553ZWU4_9BACI|nr:penicillinase repressor BlaI [Alkalicoccobacillus porphyridii]TSB45938.1 penicillinase repressor BlaI [Alkalicoccobacillus porphyridii]
MNRELPSITEAEWEVMKALWKQSPKTANQIIKDLNQRVDWKPKTIRTLLDRLTKKQVVEANKEERIYTFSPLYTEAECKRSETKSFVNRVYEGTTKSMLVQFLEEETLTKSELQELRDLLDDKIE